MRGSASWRAGLRRAAARGAALLRGRPAGGLRILTYHRVNDHHPKDRLTVSCESFRRQMETLAEAGRPVVPLAGALRALQGSEGSLPEGAVAITFDDGYADNHAHALPVLERLGLPATFFLATGLVGSANTLDRYARCCDRDGMMTWAEARELQERGHDLGGHGRLHRELAGLAPDAAREEVSGCADDLARHAGRRPSLFCYPRGSESPGVRALVAACGYLGACTVYPGANLPGVDLFGLRRTEIAGSDELPDFRLKLEGAFDAWHTLVQAARGRAPRG